MKKRFFSIMISIVMMLSAMTTVFAAADYDEIKPLQTTEVLLDQLNADKDADIFDRVQHQNQFDILKAVNESFDSLAASADWSDYIRVVYEEREVAYIEDYMKLLEIAKTDSDVADELAAVDALYDTTGDSLKESFAQFHPYKDAMRPVIANNRAKLDAYTLTDSQLEGYLLLPTKLVFNAIFSQIGTGSDSKALDYNYHVSWLGNDHAKKLYAMLFGEALTGELSSDEDESGVVSTLKEMMKTEAGMKYVKEQLAYIFDESATKEEAVDAMYDFIGNVLYRAYKDQPELQLEVQMLFGGNGKTGAFEYGMKAIDPQNNVSNVLLNLFLSEYVQTTLSASEQKFATITSELPLDSAEEDAARIQVNDNASIGFVPENIFEDYDVTNENVIKRLKLSNDWFDVICYVDPATESSYVTFNGAKINVETDSALPSGENYEAYLVLYRKGAASLEERFIESYPVLINNKATSTGGGGGGGVVVSRYTLEHRFIDGTVYKTATYNKGTTVAVEESPKKNGYIFNGWYSDETLTSKVTSVVMNSNIVVYGSWIKDGGSVVSVVDVPKDLNGKDHFAYIMGYPEGDVRPYGNITRAETATMIFRLLKDDVRTNNLSETNQFVDVEGDDWYNTAVSTLADLGIIKGRTETEFMPNAYITRAEFATMFARLAEFDVDPGETYSDIAGHWAEDYILEASSYGWIAGYEDGTFRPNNAITRAEAMTLVNRVLKRVPETKEDLLSDMIAWVDNSDNTAWYYLAVQEATNSHEYKMKNESFEKWTVLTENRDWTVYEK